MPNKYVVVLGCAFNPSNKQVTAFGDERIRQYVAGLEKMVELGKEFPQFDFILVDNTVSPEWQMPPELAQTILKIPNVKTVLFYENELAAKNKGCGVMAGWKKIVNEGMLNSYEYFLYFEPRQQLVDTGFFRRFLEKPANYFQIKRYRVTASSRPFLVRLFFKIFPVHKSQINNGLFSLRPKQFADYVNKVSLQEMADKMVSLEDDLYEKLKHVNFVEVERLGYIWHNAFLNKDIEF